MEEEEESLEHTAWKVKVGICVLEGQVLVQIVLLSRKIKVWGHPRKERKSFLVFSGSSS